MSDQPCLSFAANARKKAIEQALHLHEWVLAEDSGLCVDYLDGAPGIYSARFAGEENRSDARNNALLLAKLQDVPLEKRGAHYACHMVLADPTGAIAFETEEICRGRILFEERGVNGFGYDPLFEIVEYHKSFGELAPEIKRAISHRARATRKLAKALTVMLRDGKLDSPSLTGLGRTNLHIFLRLAQNSIYRNIAATLRRARNARLARSPLSRAVRRTNGSKPSQLCSLTARNSFLRKTRRISPPRAKQGSNRQ